MPSESQLATVSYSDSTGLSTGAPLESQFLIFGLADILYALPARSVREIHWLPELSPLDEAAPAVAGLLNLRGQVLPVLDLSERLGHAATPYDLEDSIIVLEYEGDWAGIIVDRVLGVTSIPEHEIESVPRFGRVPVSQGNFVQGLAKVSGEVVMLLHTGNLLQAFGSGVPATENELAGADTGMPPGSARIFAPQATEAERTIFRERALRLRTPIEDQDTRGLFSMALVKLNGEYFGVSLNQVREFCDLRTVTPVPCCPEHILGQMNLRGDVVTLVDIQPLLNLPPRRDLTAAKVLVTQFQDAPVGILLDDVLDVLYKHPEEVNLLHTSANASSSAYYSGGVFHEGRMICLLHLPKMLSEDNLVVDEVP